MNLKGKLLKNKTKNSLSRHQKQLKPNFFLEDKTHGIHRLHGAKPAMLEKLPTRVH